MNSLCFALLFNAVLLDGINIHHVPTNYTSNALIGKVAPGWSMFIEGGAVIAIAIKDNDLYGVGDDYKIYKHSLTGSKDCGKIDVRGYWERADTVIPGLTYRETYGWEETTGSSSTNEWQASFGMSVTAGFTASYGFSDVSAEVEVNSEYSRGGSVTVEESNTNSGEVEMEYNATESGALWQWIFIGEDRCWNSAKMKTKSLLLTNSFAEPPCCPVGLFRSADNPRGACQEKNILCVRSWKVQFPPQ